MNWRDWVPPVLQRKASSVARAIVQIYLGEPIWTPKNFENLAREGFEQNVWVYRCIMAIAQAAAGVPWLLYERRQGNVREIEQHPLLDLIQRPNPLQSKQEYTEAVVAFLLLSGNAYEEENGPNVGPPQELWPLRPDRVRVLPDTENLIGGYRYEVNGRRIDFATDRVMHTKLFAALDDFYGLSPIAVAARGIDGDNAANAWNASMFQNGGRPSGALYTEQSLSESQYTRLQKQVKDKYTGVKNAGRPLLLEGGLKWQEMSLSPKDMDFIQSKKLSRLEICAAFGVPPELVGDHEHATYSNYQEARQAFYEDTVLPILDKLRDKRNAHLVPKFGANLYLDYDRDGIEALQESREKVWDRVLRAHAQGLLTDNEGRDALGYANVIGGNVRRIPMSVYLQGEDAQEISLSDDDSKQALLLKSFNLRTEEQKEVYWKAIDRRRGNYQGSFFRAIKKRFTEEQRAVLEAFESGGSVYAEAAHLAQLEEWRKLLKQLGAKVMEDFGTSTYEGFKSAFVLREQKNEFNVYAEEVQRFIEENVGIKISAISETTLKALKEAMTEGENLGESVAEIAVRMQTVYEGFGGQRAFLIARTEIISYSNAGSRYAAKQTGLDLEKEWISTRDDRTRASHEDMDGERRDMDEPYSNGLMFPGDPNGRAKEIVQCRCTEGYSVKRRLAG